MPNDISYRSRLNRIDRLDRIATRLDARFRLPVIGTRFGWAGLLGLVPGVGDLATAVPGAFIFYEGVQMGASRRTLARIGINTMVDLLFGVIPVVGDMFDLFFKSHRRNVALLRRDLYRRRLRPQPAAV